MGWFGVVLMVLGVALVVGGVALNPTVPAGALGRAVELGPIGLRPMLASVGIAMIVAGGLFLAVARVLRRVGREVPWIPVAARNLGKDAAPGKGGERPP